MKIRAFPRIDKSYEIVDGNLIVRDFFGASRQTIGLDSVNITARQSIFNFTGPVILHHPGNTVIRCAGIIQPERFKKALENQKTAHSSGAHEESTKLHAIPGAPPPGIEFSENVFLIPALDNRLQAIHPCGDIALESRVKCRDKWQWINRGDPFTIFSFAN